MAQSFMSLTDLVPTLTMAQAAPEDHAGEEEDNGDIPPAFHKLQIKQGLPDASLEPSPSSPRVQQLSSANPITSSWPSATSCTGQPINCHWRTKRTPRPGRTHRISYNRCKRQLNASTGTHLQVQLGIGAPMPETGTVAPGTAKVRDRHNLKPWELSFSTTPSEFHRTTGYNLMVRGPRTGTAPLQPHQ